MARTNLKHARIYVGGYDLSGYVRSPGSMEWSFGVGPDAALTDEVMNIVMGRPTINAGPFNSFLDNTVGGEHEIFNAGGLNNYVFITCGRNAAPANGDPVFAAYLTQTGYTVESGDGFVAANMTNGGISALADMTYSTPWGWLLHAKGAETAVNTATGIDDYGASTAKGGLFAWQLFSSNGTVTLKTQHASTNSNGSFSDLTGATSGAITAASTPTAGMIGISATATVNRYLRWQLVFGTATTATFAVAFIRNFI